MSLLENTGEIRDEVGPGRPPLAHAFKPGNPGRPKGSRNKLAEDFIAALQADFKDNGPAVIQEVRTDDPSTYLKIIASILPKEFKFERGPADDLTDDELFRLIVELRRVVAEKAGGGLAVADAAQGAATLQPVSETD